MQPCVTAMALCPRREKAHEQDIIRAFNSIHYTAGRLRLQRIFESLSTGAVSTSSWRWPPFRQHNPQVVGSLRASADCPPPFQASNSRRSHQNERQMVFAEVVVVTSLLMSAMRL